MAKTRWGWLSLLCALGWLWPAPAPAIPVFARQYGVTCEKCHSVVPHLNAFGAAFLANANRIPGVRAGPAVPVASKVNFVDSSRNQGSAPDGAGLPKAIVDEIELFAGGTVGTRASYFVEQYAVDGGMPGLLRDAWINDRVNPWHARAAINVQIGSFTLPLPVDPETFRESNQHYAVYDQTVAANPFNFFDPKIGGRLSVGDPLRGLSFQGFAGPGHDRQSGVPAVGTDFMNFLQESLGRFELTLYRYDGTRPAGDRKNDAFERTGYGLVFDQWGRFSSESLLQTGWDSNCGSVQTGCSSSGGFTQFRYAFSARYFGVARYEGISDSSGIFSRDAVLLLGYGPTERSRLTAEVVIQHNPQTSHSFNVQMTVAQ